MAANAINTDMVRMVKTEPLFEGYRLAYKGVMHLPLAQAKDFEKRGIVRIYRDEQGRILLANGDPLKG